MKPKKLFHRNFSLMIIGQIISLFGNAILRFALSMYVLDLTGSAAAFGTILAVSMIPTVLLSPVGGIIADRINRRNIMVALDFTTAGLIVLAKGVAGQKINYTKIVLGDGYLEEGQTLSSRFTSPPSRPASQPSRRTRT